jgi:hypothetical protein
MAFFVPGGSSRLKAISTRCRRLKIPVQPWSLRFGIAASPAGSKRQSVIKKQSTAQTWSKRRIPRSICMATLSLSRYLRLKMLERRFFMGN